jgi:hypothetical protein
MLKELVGSLTLYLDKEKKKTARWGHWTTRYEKRSIS